MPALTTAEDIAALEALGIDAFAPQHSLIQALAAVAAAHGPRPAITALASADIDAPVQQWTHAQLLQRVHQTANLLHALGVDDEHAVAFLLPAMPAAYLALLGGATAGRVCPINFLLDAANIAGLIEAAKARVLIALAPCAELDIAAKALQLRALCPGLQRILWVGGNAGAEAAAAALGAVAGATTDAADNTAEAAAAADETATDSFEALIAQQPGHTLVFERHTTRDTVAALFHTGGTTGAPKLAQHTHGNQLHTAVSAGHFYASTERDVMLNGFPLFHVAGAFVFGLSTLLAGGHVVLPPLLGMRDAAFVRHYWRCVQRHGVTLLAAVPTVISTLMNVDAADADIQTVRALLTGGSPLPDELAAAFERRYRIPVRNILGMTECAGIISIEPFHAPRVPGSCGLRLPFTEVCAVAVAPAAPGARGEFTESAAPRPLPAGRTGILALRGPNVGPGYTDAARDAGTFVHGWLITGDIGHVAADGRIFITGRAKDVIIRSAHNIDPGLIEEALLRHPQVLHAAAVGEPDEYAGELPVAFVTLKPGSALAALPADEAAAALLREITPMIAERPAVPKRLTLIAAMPMTAIGKVYKPALRLLALQQAFDERLARAGLSGDVSVRAEEQARGLALCFVISGGGSAETRSDPDTAAREALAITRLMAPFALPYRLQGADGS